VKVIIEEGIKVVETAGNNRKCVSWFLQWWLRLHDSELLSTAVF
jgi:hypothetical protein